MTDQDLTHTLIGIFFSYFIVLNINIAAKQEKETLMEEEDFFSTYIKVNL